MAERRGVSGALAASGIILVLAYLFLLAVLPRIARDAGALLWSLEAFLSPGLVNKPGQWLLAELIQFGLAVAGMVCLGAAAVARGASRDSFAAAFRVRGHWRELIWAILLGGYGSTVLFTILQWVVPYAALQEPSPVARVGGWIAIVGQVCGLVVCARLLFAQERQWYEPWLGRILAGLTLLSLGWSLLSALGLGFGSMLGPYSRQRGLGDLLDLAPVLAFGVGAAWTGLFIARRRNYRPVRTRSVPVIAYLCAGAILFSLALGNAGSIGFLFREVTPIAVGYGATVLLFLAVALAAVMHAARLVAGTAEMLTVEPAAPTRWSTPLPSPERDPAPVAGRSRRIGFDTAVGFVASVVLLGIGYLFVSRIDIMALAFVMPFALAVMFGGPLLVFVFGFLRGRVGYSIGAAILLLGIAGYRQFNLMKASLHAKAAVEQAASLNIYPFQAPKQPHTVLAVVDSYQGSVKHVDCRDLCRLVLLGSSYTFAVADQGEARWHVLRLQKGDVCNAAENRESMFGFLAAGHPQTCATETIEPQGADALIIRQNASSDGPIRQQLPKDFRGNAYEFLERIDGRDTLLGRVVWGGVQPPLLSNNKEENVKPVLDEVGFYAAVLKLPGSTLPPIAAQDAKASIAVYLDQLDHLEQLGPNAFNDVQGSWAQFLQAPKDQEATKVAKDAVAALVVSGDPMRSRLGLYSLFSFHDDLEFAKAPLAALVTGDAMKLYTQSPGNLLEIMKKIKGPYPEAQRTAAKTALQRPGAKTEIERLALLSVFGHGGAKERADAAAFILALPEDEFQKTVATMGSGLQNMEIVTEPPMITFWSDDDLKQIVQRAPKLPDELLAGYIGAVQFMPGVMAIRGELKDLARARLAAGPSNPKVRDDLNRLLKFL